jgi:predicted TIM-barrel fold metal-dependent hydrolase
MLDAIGFTRGVLVQPSIYGTDNRLLLEVLRARPDRLRGVAVLDPAAAASEARAMDGAGVRGFRINLLFRGGVNLDALEPTAAAVADLGWHAQLLMDLRALPDLASRLADLPVPVVIDHLGHFPAELGTEWEGFRTLLALAECREVWVKVSGFYRLDPEPGRGAVEPIARRLIETMPDRLVWGSDWPHVGLTGAMPDTGDLLNAFLAWCPDADRRRAILVGNGARLYRFDPA